MAASGDCTCSGSWVTETALGHGRGDSTLSPSFLLPLRLVSTTGRPRKSRGNEGLAPPQLLAWVSRRPTWRRRRDLTACGHQDTAGRELGASAIFRPAARAGSGIQSTKLLAPRSAGIHPGRLDSKGARPSGDSRGRAAGEGARGSRSRTPRPIGRARAGVQVPAASARPQRWWDGLIPAGWGAARGHETELLSCHWLCRAGWMGRDNERSVAAGTLTPQLHCPIPTQ